MPFATIADYELLIYSLRDVYPSILASTLRLIRSGPMSGQVIGQLDFAEDIRLVVAEIVEFPAFDHQQIHIAVGAHLSPSHRAKQDDSLRLGYLHDAPDDFLIIVPMLQRQVILLCTCLQQVNNVVQ